MIFCEKKNSGVDNDMRDINTAAEKCISPCCENAAILRGTERLCDLIMYEIIKEIFRNYRIKSKKKFQLVFLMNFLLFLSSIFQSLFQRNPIS